MDSPIWTIESCSASTFHFGSSHGEFTGMEHGMSRSPQRHSLAAVPLLQVVDEEDSRDSCEVAEQFFVSQSQVEDVLSSMRGGSSVADAMAAEFPGVERDRTTTLPTDTAHTCVCVLGVSSFHLPRSDGVPAKGVGKSCLCSRFVHPSHDEYWTIKEEHESVVLEQDFQESEHCGMHSLYFGSVVKSVPEWRVARAKDDAHSPVQSSATATATARDSRKGGGGDDEVAVFHIVEHTTLVDPDTQLPHHGGSADAYTSRATSSSLFSARPHAYIGKRFAGLQLEKRERLPPIFNGMQAYVSGYLLVLDVSRCPEELHQQLAALLDMLLSVRKQRLPHRVALALTKCDAVSAQRLAEVRATIGDGPLSSVAAFEVSARKGVGIEAPFFYIYRSARSMSCLDAAEWHVPYEISAEARRLASQHSRRQLAAVLAETVSSFQVTYDKLLHLTACADGDGAARAECAIAAALHLLGKKQCKEMLRERLVQVKAAELLEDYRAELQRAMQAHSDFAKDAVACDLPGIDLSRPHTSGAAGIASHLALGGDIESLVDMEARAYHESAMVDMLGVHWDTSSPGTAETPQVPRLATLLLYDGSVQRSKMLLRVLTGSCFTYPSLNELSMYTTSPPGMLKAVSMFNIATTPAAPSNRGSAIYAEVGPQSSLAKQDSPPELPPRPRLSTGRVTPLENFVSNDTASQGHSDRLEAQRRRFGSDSTAKKRAKSPGFMGMAGWKKSTSAGNSKAQSRAGSVEHLATMGGSSPHGSRSFFSTSQGSHLGRANKSAESLLASPPTGRSPGCGSPLFLGPAEADAACFSPCNIHSAASTKQSYYQHSRSNSSPVFQLSANNAAASSHTSPVNGTPDTQEDDGYLAPGEIRLSQSQAVKMPRSDMPGGTLPRSFSSGFSALTSLGGSTAMPATPYRPRSRSFGESLGLTISAPKPTRKGQFFPIHMTSSASTDHGHAATPPFDVATLFKNVGQPEDQALVALMSRSALHCQSPVRTDESDDELTASQGGSDSSTEEAFRGFSAGPTVLKRRGSLAASAFQPIRPEDFHFVPVAAAPTSPTVFERDEEEVDSELASPMQPHRPADMVPRPLSCLSMSKEMTDV